MECPQRPGRHGPKAGFRNCGVRTSGTNSLQERRDSRERPALWLGGGVDGDTRAARAKWIAVEKVGTILPVRLRPAKMNALIINLIRIDNSLIVGDTEARREGEDESVRSVTGSSLAVLPPLFWSQLTKRKE